VVNIYGDIMDDKMKVLLALGATEPPPAGACPSDEKLAAFVDNRLGPEERNSVFKHLDACSSCYRQWLDISAIREEESGKSVPVVQARKKKIYWSSGFAVAAAACLVLILWRTALRSPEMADMLAKSYKTALRNEMSLKHVEPGRIPRLPWEVERTRGEHSKPDSSASRAFTEGFTSGRDELAEDKDTISMDSEKWDKTKWAPCFFLGRWCVLLQSVCQSGLEMPSSFWEQQSEVSVQIEEMFNKWNDTEETYETKLVKKALKRIKPILKGKPSGVQDSGSICRRLEPELEAIKASLS
jgi:hypothetical protein